MNFTKTTEQTSKYEHLENVGYRFVDEYQQRDKTVPLAVEKALPQIEKLVTEIVSKMKQRWSFVLHWSRNFGAFRHCRCFRMSANFGVPFDLVIGIIAGGDKAIRKAVEFAEDDREQAWKDLQQWNINENDVVVGIAAWELRLM